MVEYGEPIYGLQNRCSTVESLSIEGRGVVTPATVVDHVEPHHGDPNKFRKLQTLCKADHDSRKHFLEVNRYASEVDLDGWPLDKMHPCYRTRSCSS
jgi:hypothetical protein